MVEAVSAHTHGWKPGVVAFVLRKADNHKVVLVCCLGVPEIPIHNGRAHWLNRAGSGTNRREGEEEDQGYHLAVESRSNTVKSSLVTMKSSTGVVESSTNAQRVARLAHALLLA